MQQTHGSLQSPGEPSVCRLSYAAYSAADEALPPGAAEPLAPFGCMGALHPARPPESPSFDICHRAPLLAACRARQSDAASRSSRRALHELTSRPASFSFANFNPYLSTAGIFWGAINFCSLAAVPCLKLLLGSSLGSGHIPDSEPSPRTASQNMLTICYQIKCKGELVK